MIPAPDTTNRQGNLGFSLLEVIVAAAVSSILLLMVYSAHRSIMYSVKDMAGIAEFYENVNLATRRIDHDIVCMISRAGDKNIFLLGENNISAPYKGKINFVTVMKSDTYINGTIRDNVHTSDIKEVGYYLKEDPKFPGNYFLMRRETPYYDDEHEKGGSSSILLENVADIRFEYSSGRTPNWDSNWDTETKNRFPAAVRTTLTVKNYRGKSETFTFISVADRTM